MKLAGRNIQLVPIAIALVLLWILYRTVLWLRFHRKYKFPNLVPGVPLFGNMLQIPTDTAGRRLYLHKLARKYGEMFTLKVGSNYWIFMNSQRVANELLDKRGARYISRQNLPMPGDVASGGKRVVFMPYGNLWKWERKLIHEIIGPGNRNVFAPLQDVESRTLLYDYLTEPDLWNQANARYASSLIMSMVFGRRTKMGDPNVDRIIETNNEIMKMFEPGSSLIDSFPFLAYIPLPKAIQPWRWWGDSVFEQSKKNFSEEFEGLAAREQQGKNVTCFVSEFKRLGRDKVLDYESTVFLAGSLIEAGSDTTRVALNQLVAGAALFPDFVKRARQDLDNVCGADAQRLPVASDIASLPYIKAIGKEVLRWNISFPEIAHSLIEDDSFEGYNIPAGTNVIWNSWGVHMDASEYENPETFWPERFMNEDLDKPIKGHLAFGAGRRVCPGWVIASNSLHLLIARVLYCFDFHQVPGHPIPVGKPFEIGTEKPYEVRISVRSAAHAALIKADCAEAANF
ncbi:Cytochrome P450 monooxygenase atE [Fusarium oxysporum f. sp. cubense]|uniref:Cytochrome P450 monooxygenase atE n=1 Tax=Fusarium oxysporum f. sp. cubense TaxID=61366 RepID=A0A559LBF5_FUSOC|nr:Cytochrome P450 monooxygenase atE [Fusarium oxysporum f. sp. cubense]